MTQSTLAAALVAGLAMSAAGAPSPHVPGDIIIRFVTPPTPTTLADVELLLGGATWHVPPHAPRARSGDAPHPLASFRVATVDPDADLAALIPLIERLPSVDFASTNNTPEPAAAPSDPLFLQQWSHQAINSEAGWAIGTGDASVIVGVIDTGCRRTHEDLAAHMWVNDDPPNGLDDDGNGFVDDTFGWNFAGGNSNTDDVYGHGTQASGIIGAGLDNGVGVAGLANVTLLTAKWWHQSGSDCSVAESVYYAVDNGASVLNLSLSCGCLMPMTEAAVDYAHANDVVIVCSAGNGGSDSPHYPAAYAPAMAVSAIDINGQHPSFSSYGAHVDVAAPSPDILTCDEDGDALYDPGFRGTSAAAPHVAGLAALVRSVNPSLTNDAVRDAINANATDVGAPGFDDLFGHGRIDVGATIAAIAPGTSCTPDLDGDGSVGPADLATLLAQWGPCAGCGSDLSGDGAVGPDDLAILLAAWGTCPK